MDFARPDLLLLLLLVPVLAVVAWRQRLGRAAAWRRLGQTTRLAKSRSGAWILVFVLLAVALAGPRWGRVPGGELPPGHDVVLLMDSSRSMAAEDTVPNRLGSAVHAAEGLVSALGKAEGNRVGVVAFAARAEPRCPLTENLGAVDDILRSIRPGDIAPGGTDLGSGLLAAMDAFDDQEPAEGRTIVVFTDGEDHVGSWREVLRRLAAAKIVVHGVTVGDAEHGHPVPSGTPSEPIRHGGSTVLSQRSDAALGAICAATGGVLIPMGRSRADLETLYRERIKPVAARVRRAERTPQRVDRYSWLVAAALGLVGSVSWPASKRLGSLAIFLAVAIGAAPKTQSMSQLITAGEAAYRSGQYADALERFESAARLGPRSAIPRYNVAATLFQMGKYEESEREYTEARALADAALKAKIDFALGNVLVARGRFAESITHYDACLESPSDEPGIALVKRDARANRAFAVKRIPPPPTPDRDGNRRDAKQPTDETETLKEASPPPRPTENDKPPEEQGGAAPPDSSSPTDAASPKGGSRGSSGGPRSLPGSPEEQLQSMLHEVAKARGTETPAPPPTPTSSDRKDW